jgi:hypothetical protein
MGKNKEPKSEECVLIYLDGVSLPDEVYAECDLSTLEDQLIEVLQKKRAGELDGHESGEKETTIFTYGPDADELYAAMESTLKSYPLCKNARVIVRKGGPGSPQTELHF